MVKYSCERCGKEFSQKSHYDSHNRRKTPCENNADKINERINTIDEELNNETNIVKNTELYEKTDIKRPLENKITELKYIDLFCGLGAFHTAFNRNNIFQNKIKYTCVLASDIDEGIRDIYEENYGIKPEGDINKINIDTIPNFNILCAGFPCQPFSIAGNLKGFKDKTRGNLFYKILEIVDKKQPSTLILENVKNLHTIHKGKTFKIIKNELEKRGYNVSYKVIDSRYYNSPQSRHRIYIICNKDKNYTFNIAKYAESSAYRYTDTKPNTKKDAKLKE